MASRRRLAVVAAAVAVVLGAGSVPADATSSSGRAGVKSCTDVKSQIVGKNPARDRLSIAVNGGSTVAFIGDDAATTLTAANGYPVVANGQWQSGQGYTGAMSCITSSGTADVRFLEEAR